MQYVKIGLNCIVRVLINIAIKYNNSCILIIIARIIYKKFCKAVYLAINLILNLIFYIYIL